MIVGKLVSKEALQMSSCDSVKIQFRTGWRLGGTVEKDLEIQSRQELDLERKSQEDLGLKACIWRFEGRRSLG